MYNNDSMSEAARQLGGIVGTVIDVLTGEVLDGAGVPAPHSGGIAGGPIGELGAGLSYPHNCTSKLEKVEGSAEFWVGGGLMKVTKPREKRPQVGGGKRGRVVMFTAQARRRLMYKMAQVKRSEMPVLITLTYPAEWSKNSEDWKNDLRKFYQRMKRVYPHAGFFWKLEPQKRGAPHFHLLAWGLSHVLTLYLGRWVSQIWYEIVGSGDIKHLYAGTRVEAIRSYQGVVGYASKYLGKVEDLPAEWENPGRFWGVKGGKWIPWADLVKCEMDFFGSTRLLRLMRRRMHCKRKNLPSLTIFCDAEQWFDRLEILIT